MQVKEDHAKVTIRLCLIVVAHAIDGKG